VGEKAVESDVVDLKAGGKLSLGTSTVTFKQDDGAGPGFRLMPMPNTQEDGAKPAPKPDGSGTPSSTGPASAVVAVGAPDTGQPGGMMFPMFPQQDQMSVTFSSSAPLDLIKSVTFLDPDGKPIKHRQSGSMSAGTTGQMQCSRTYGLERKVPKLKVKVVHFERIEPVKVPLAIETGVGF
jgi:hypothetical protein